LTDPEREALLTACKNSANPDLFLAVILAISTGMRKGEIMGMRWQDIHASPEQNFTRVHLTKTKNNQDRSVLIPSHALKLLEERRAKVVESQQGKPAKGLIFPGPISTDHSADLRKPWAVGCGHESSRYRGIPFSRSSPHHCELPGHERRQFVVDQ
jgi:integrase